MSGIFGILQTGRQALQTQMTAIEVTGHNIANVNTPGYTRQRVNMVTNLPISAKGGLMIGTGVTAEGVQRIYDRFLDNQINNEAEDLGRWEAQKGALGRVETILNEASDYGLNQSMGEFWNAWQDLANNPSGYVERVSLLGKSEIMANQFQQTYDALSQIQTDLDAGIAETVAEINLKAAEIADFNEKIVGIEAGGNNANDYRDARNLAVKDLALMIDITTTEDSNGSITVTLGDGGDLVLGNSSPDLSTMDNAGYKDVVWASASGTSINSSIAGGKLKGWLEVRDVIIPEYKENMEDLVNGIKGVESTEVVTGAADTLSNGVYFTISSPESPNTTPPTPAENYYVWYTTTSGSGDPTPAGLVGIEVFISANDTAAQVATKTAAAIAGVTDAGPGNSVFDVSVTGGATLTISNVIAGDVTDSADNNTGFTITKRIDGGEGVNYYHSRGYGLDDSTGNDFFSGTLAGNSFAVNSVITANANKIAAATASGLPGDNSNAIAIAELQNALKMNSDTTTFDDYYNATVSDAGTKAQQSAMNYDHQTSMVTYLENYRDSISGVSLDEEMVNLVQFQHGYDAAAKLIGTVDELLETLINMV